MFVFDAHLHVINRQFYRGGDIGQRVEDGHFDLVRAKEGGLDALFFTLFITEDYYPGHYETKQALRLIDLAYLAGGEELPHHWHRPQRGRNSGAAQAGRLAAVLDLEGGFDMDGDLGVLRALHQLGVRSIQLPAHNFANNFADSCCAITRFNGLTAHGRAVVAECNLASASSSTSLMPPPRRPSRRLPPLNGLVVSTHDGLRSRNNIPRLMTEATLEKLARKGGLIGFHIGNEFHNRALFDYRTRKAGKPFWDRSDVKKTGRR
jgi:membrane dipeptidase